MKLSKKGLLLIAEFEGLRLSPYYATAEEKSKGIATIGYGSTFYPNGTKVKITDPPINKERALDILEVTANNFASKIAILITSNVTQNQFDAMVSLAYNIGLSAFKLSSVLRIANKNPNDTEIRKWFMAWNKQAGQELAGLTKRRQKEADLYFSK